MKRITFSTIIKAPKNVVWQTMLNDSTYREWTSVFQEGSHAVTDWKEGSKAMFLTPAGDGMFSRIEVHRPNEFLSIQHLGTIKNGVEDKESEEAKVWFGAFENYAVRENDGASTLTIDMDVTEAYTKYFEETWPKALAKLKEVVERGSRSRSSAG